MKAIGQRCLVFAFFFAAERFGQNLGGFDFRQCAELIAEEHAAVFQLAAVFVRRASSRRSGVKGT